MNRSNEVVKDLLLLVEKEAQSTEDGRRAIYRFRTSDEDESWLTRPGLDKDLVIHHWELLIQEGLVVGDIDEMANGYPIFSITDLTWAGHELLDAVRQEPVWKEMNELADKSGIDLKSVATDVLFRFSSKATEMLLERGLGV